MNLIVSFKKLIDLHLYTKKYNDKRQKKDIN
jgi:hypothetical protein